MKEKKLVIEATVKLEIDPDEPIRREVVENAGHVAVRKQFIKAGEIPVEFVEHDLRQILEEKLGKVIKLTEFKIQSMEAK